MQSITKTSANPYYFLQGGGEMGELARNFNWSQTKVGDPATWPQSLRTVVALILSSRFPMFLWWGEDLVQFYNDAYRPSLGNNGKHPAALGQKGVDCWPEIWHIIYPLIKQVFTTGEATWSEDQLVPIYRNGRLEDVYWTFGYSPVHDNDGNIQGVLVVCTETTDKVIAAKTLAASEKRFQNLVEEATVGIIVLTGNDLVVEVANNVCGKLVGCTTQQLLNKPLFNVVPEAEPYFKDIIESVRRTGEPVHLSSYPYFTMASGTKEDGFFNLVYQPYFETNGDIKGVMVLCQDVTPQVRALRKVEESESRVRSIIESAPFPIGAYTGKEMRIELANNAMLNAWGKGTAVVGKLYSEVLPELAGQEIFEQLDRVYTTGVALHIKNRRVDIVVDGKLQPFYFNYSFTPLYDGAGNVYGVMNTAADVTDLALAKQKVEENEKSFRNTILTAPVAMCILKGPTFIIEIANEEITALWGKKLEDVLNKPMFDAVPEAKHQGFEQLLENVYNTGQTFAAQDVPVTLPRNGKIENVYVNFVFAATREADGTISGIIAVATDVTAQVIARQKIEEVVAERTKELAEANTNLERSNAALAQFAYIASHDLQEPLRKVTTFAEMLERSLGNMDERSKSYLDKINSSTERMTTLVRDVLAYSQLSKENDVYAQVDLQQIIDGVENDFELLIQQKEAVITCTALPVIQAIPLQMAQLFGNLVSNALKFTKEGIAPVINIAATVLSAEKVVEMHLPLEKTIYYSIEFKDNGIGFNQQYAEQIFNIFQRLHGKTEYSGTGIGLAMCKKIVQNHHGNIYATASDDGAMFHVILPAQQKTVSTSNKQVVQ